MNVIKIIDRCIGDSYQNLIEDITYKNLQFPWYFSPSITQKTNYVDVQKNDAAGWSHVFIKNSTPTSDVVSSLVPLAYEAADKNNLNVKNITEGRIFMLTPSDTTIKLWHVDQIKQHTVLLYYVNETDGDTVISDDLFDGIHQFNDKLNPKKIETVSPKKGRCVIFNGLQYHHATAPSLGRRIVINFNIEI